MSNIPPPDLSLFENADPTTKKLGYGVGILAGVASYALGAGLVLSGVAGVAGLAGVLYAAKMKKGA
jgi:hypothetical protein